MAKGKKSSANQIVRGVASGTTTSKPHSYLPAVEDIHTAVVSLYADQLRPYSRIVRKRLVEQAEARHVEGKDCDATVLRTLCEACNLFRVVLEDGGEWSVLLCDRPDEFIDIYSSQDPYVEELWSAARGYFQNLGTGEITGLPGGRYASALALVHRELPFFQGYTLGQVCHIIELAISQRKLLGYADGAIVAYERSTSLKKKICATEQRAIDTADGHGIPYTVVDWDMARIKLREILLSSQQRGASSVPISNVKRLFRSLYHMELSETSLGYAKLTELLQDETFKDVCCVQLQDRGYVVVPVEKIGPIADRVEFCRDEPLCLEEAEPVAYACATPSPSPQYPRIGLKPGLASLNAQNQSLCSLLGFEPMKPNVVTETIQHHTSHKPERVRFCPDEPLDVDATGEEPTNFMFPTPSPSPYYPMSDPSFEPVWGQIGQPLAAFEAFAPINSSRAASERDEPVDESSSRICFCIDEPLSVQEAGFATTLATSPAFEVTTPSPLPQAFQPPTPSPYPQYSRSGISVSQISQDYF